METLLESITVKISNNGLIYSPPASLSIPFYVTYIKINVLHAKTIMLESRNKNFHARILGTPMLDWNFSIFICLLQNNKEVSIVN